ncbi:unnamed protein product, partial [Polarella glacialis]
RHWIVDVAREAAAADEPVRAVDLLQQRLAVHSADAGHCATKRARLQLALGEALSARGSLEDLEEAVKAYKGAAEALALLFGDDHREHQEAAQLQDMTARKVASFSVDAAATNKTQAGIFIKSAEKGKKKRK